MLLQLQYNDINQGRCGECGDEWSLPRPRDNDEGGLYGNNIIAGTYKAGDVNYSTKNVNKTNFVNIFYYFS